jgi:hypothetical protein
MAAFLSDLVISAIPTFAVSRVLLWISKLWPNNTTRLVTVHAVSLGLCIGIGLLVFEGTVVSRLLAALALFAPGQLAWLLVDAFRMVLRRRRGP